MADGQKKSGDDLSVGISSDQPTTQDTIGFGPYSDALKLLLTHETTDPPLTVSVEGKWGQGKSSFMRQLRKKLDDDDYRTVEFNPWRHEADETLWATFVLEFFRQIRESDQQSKLDNVRAGLRLFRLRLDLGENIWKTSRDIFLLIILTFGLLAFPFILYFHGPSLLADSSQNGILKLVLGSSGAAVSGVALLTLGNRVTSRLMNPIRVDFDEYLQKPNYEARRTFVSEFHEDFKRIVDSYTDEEPVFVFIDDLDRCQIPKAADLMQSINHLLDSHPQLIFILGLDRQKIAAGIAAENEEILPYLSNSSTDPSEGEEGEGISNTGLDFGYRYLEKFIQLPLNLPRPKEEDTRDLLRPDQEESTNQSGPEKSLEPIIETALFTRDSETLERVSQMISPVLNNNPRRIKKFGNVYRLQAILASQESVLAIDEDSTEGVTLEQLAKFVVLRIQWPRLSSVSRRNPTILTELTEYATGEKAKNELSELAELWTDSDSLLTLLAYESQNENVEMELRGEDFLRLIQVAPPLDRGGETSSESDELQIPLTDFDTPNLSKLFGKPSRSKMVEVLLNNPNEWFTQQELAKEANVSQTTINRNLAAFLESDIVEESESTRPRRFKINLDSDIVQLFQEMDVDTLSD